jgi:hypothetical protein
LKVSPDRQGRTKVGPSISLRLEARFDCRTRSDSPHVKLTKVEG